jgi:hypothetical protein
VGCAILTILILLTCAVGPAFGALASLFALLYMLVSNIASFLRRSSGSDNLEGGEGDAN